MDVHDAHPLQAPDLVTERRAHAPDLAVETLRQHDAEALLVDALDPAGQRQLSHDAHAACDHIQRQLRDRPLHGDDVLLLVVVLSPQDLVDDVAVVGQQDQALGILIEAPYGKYPFLVPDKFDDVAIDVRFAGAGDANRLVQRDVNVLLALADRLAVDAHFVTDTDLGAEHGGLAVAGNAPLLDPLVGLAARTGTRLADELVQSQRIGTAGSRPRNPSTLASSNGAAPSRRSTGKAAAATMRTCGARGWRASSSRRAGGTSPTRTIPRMMPGRISAISTATAAPECSPSRSSCRRRNSD